VLSFAPAEKVHRGPRPASVPRRGRGSGKRDGGAAAMIDAGGRRPIPEREPNEAVSGPGASVFRPGLRGRHLLWGARAARFEVLDEQVDVAQVVFDVGVFAPGEPARDVLP